MNKINILFLDTKPIRRGAQVFIHELKNEFKSKGYSVNQIFIYSENKYSNLDLDKTDVVLPFSSSNILDKIFLFHPLIILRLFLLIKKLSPDIILCNGSRTLKYAALIKKVCSSKSPKYVYRVIDSPFYWNKKKLTKLVYKKAIIPMMDASIGVSNKSLSEMIKHYDFHKPSLCIPRAVDVNHYGSYSTEINYKSKFGINEDHFVFLFLGNFTAQKRPDRFISTIYNLSKLNPKISGLMVGDGDLNNDVNDLIDKLDLRSTIKLAGYQHDVRPFIYISDILLLTSDTEGMPGVVLEAAAMKKPTISGNVGGVSEFIKDKDNGIIVDWSSPDNVTNLLYDLTFDFNRLSELGSAAYLKVSKDYSMKNIFISYENFFNSIEL